MKIYYNGSIITMQANSGEEEIAEMPGAVLVRKGKIAAVGNLEEVKSVAGRNAELVDLRGKCLMPAFVDPHSHVFMNGQMSLCANLGNCESFQEIEDALNDYLKVHKISEKGVLLGFGYDHNFLKEGRQPDKRLLDRVSKDIPILILHVSAHLACVNSKALELAGITSDMPNPEGE